MAKNIYDVAILGSGVAGTFAALKIAEKNKNIKTILFDIGSGPGKRRTQTNGFLGLFPVGDGKLYSNDVNKVSQLVDGRTASSANRWVKSVLEEAGQIKVIKDSTPSAAVLKRIKEQNFSVATNDYIQWKPESVHKLSKLISAKIEDKITFSFENEVYSILKKKNQFVITTYEGETIAKKLILCAGRSGWRWTQNLFKSLGLIVSDDTAHFGIRIEMGAQYLRDFNRSHCILTKEGLEIGPFSWGGTVIPEDHTDLVISAFRSNEDRWRTDKVSFSLLGAKMFKDSGTWETERLSKLLYVLNNDRVCKEKLRAIHKGTSQLSLLKEYDWLKPTLKDLELVIPNLNKAYFHTPNILPLPAKILIGTNLETEVRGLYVCGESAGITGILSAAMTGTICAQSINK